MTVHTDPALTKAPITSKIGAVDPFTEFTAPLAASEIEWKIQATTKDKSKTIIVPYIDARAVLNRLDTCFGPGGWFVEYREIHAAKEDGFIAQLSIKIDGQWISKEDASSCTDIEPIKGGVSGSLKRAAMVWGLGRELYNYPRVFVLGEIKYIPNKVLKRLNGLVEAFNQGTSIPNVITLDEDGKSAK